MAYPPFGDRYTSVAPTLAYHDAWTTWGSAGATHVSEYAASVSRDREHGYAGQFMDDVNFAGGNIAGTRAQYANLIEAVRSALGPAGILEINAQMWDIWPLMRSGDPDVARALSFTNMVDKEFGVVANSGISSPGSYATFFAYVDALHAKGIHIDLSSSEPGDQFSLATYLLLSDGRDFIGTVVTPQTWWPGFALDLGAASSARERSSTGVWSRRFAGGAAYTLEPGASGSQTVTLPSPMRNLAGQVVSSLTLSPGGGAVLTAP